MHNGGTTYSKCWLKDYKVLPVTEEQVTLSYILPNIGKITALKLQTTDKNSQNST